MLKKFLELMVILIVISTPAFSGVEGVEKMCAYMGVKDCSLVKAVAWAESGYRNITRPDNGSLSYGPMQIKCLTARSMGFHGKCEELMITSKSIYYGIMYLDYQLRRYGNYEEAVSGYNAGTAFWCKEKCPRGQLINQEHVSRVKERYSWLKNKSPRILDRFLSSFSSWVGLENSMIAYKRVYPILLVSTDPLE